MTPGAGSLTVDGVETVSVIYASPQTPGVYDQTVILTGATFIDNPAYSGLVMQFGTTPDSPPQPVAVTVNATVEIGANVVANSGPGGFGTIWVRNDYAGTIDIDNAGTVTGTFTDSNTAAISGVSNLGAVTITNSGSVISTGGRGIYADGNHNGADDATVSVINTATGSVQATTAGIRVIAYNGLASITNDGTVGSTLFQGLIAWSADGDATITNGGTVTSNTDNAVYAATNVGTATVTNSGTVTATGDTAFDAARALIRAPVGYSGLIGTASTSGDIFITNEATGIVTASRDSAIRAATPQGDVTIVNAGSLTGLTGIYVDSGLSGALTSATAHAIDGDVSVTNSGTVAATSYAVWLDGTTNLLANSGTIQTTGDTAVYTGNGDTTVINTGTIAASSASETAISMGSGNNRLVLSDTATLVGRVENVSSGNTLELTGSATGSLDLGTVHAAGQFQGFSQLAKSGSGTWTITGGGSSITDSLAVNQGTLVLQGTLSVVTASVGSDDVDGRAVLAGTGTIGGNVDVNAGGAIIAGTDRVPGTLTIDGDLVFTSGATFGVQIDGESEQAGLVHVTGTASLAGTVALFGLDDRFRGDHSYTILTADEGYTGAFSGIDYASAFLDAALVYGDDVLLTLARNDVDLADVAGTPNQAATANGLESLGGHNEILQRILMLDTNGARDSYDSLSGEIAAATQGGLVLSSQFFSHAAQQRISQAFGDDASGATRSILVSSYGPAPELAAGAAGRRTAIWTSFDGARGRLDGSANTASIDRQSVGGAVGIDFAPSESARVGVLAAYHSADYDVDGRASSSAADSWEVGVYGGMKFDRLTLSAGAGYAWHDIETARIASIGNVTEALSGSTSGGSLQLFGEISQAYVLPFGAQTLQVEPFAGVDYVRLTIDGYQETGGIAALSIAGSETDVAYSTLGIRGSLLLPSMDAGARLNGMFGWRHGFGDLTPTSTARFVGGSAFTVEGAPLSKNLALVGAGVAMDLSPTTSFSVDYRGAFGETSTENGGEARFTLRF